MADDQGRGGRSSRSTRRSCSRCPSAGRATELMDHGAAGRARPDAPQRRARPGRGRPRPVPGHEARHRPVITDGFYYDFQLPRPLTPDDLPAIEARMRESIAADHPFEFSEETPEAARAALVERDQPFKVEIVDDLAAAAERDGTPMPPDDLLPAGTVHRPVPRPARGEHGQDRTVQAARHGRCLLARRRDAADAPARLRHRLGDPGGARCLPVAARGGEEARPPPARRGARPVLVPRRVAGLGVLAPQGPAHLADARIGDARAPGPARLPGGLDPDPRQRAAVAPVGPLGPLRREHVHRREREAAVQPQADELPRIDVHLSSRTCARTATCRCACRSSGGCIATSAPGRCRD